MFRKMMNAAGASAMTAASLGLGLGLSAMPAPASAQTYWGCDAGYDFQVNREAGRCFKAGRTETLPPIPCPRINTPLGAVGAALRIDNNGENDVCATNVGVVFTAEVQCLPGWQIDRRPGADRCQKREASDAKQPTRAVVR